MCGLPVKVVMESFGNDVDSDPTGAGCVIRDSQMVIAPSLTAAQRLYDHQFIVLP
jgi:hypothetical protein